MSIFARIPDPVPRGTPNEPRVFNNLDFRAKDLARPILQVAQIRVPFTVY